MAETLTRFDRATRFTGMLICMLSSIALLFAGVIGESVWQYTMLGSYLVYSGADVGERWLDGMGR